MTELELACSLEVSPKVIWLCIETTGVLCIIQFFSYERFLSVLKICFLVQLQTKTYLASFEGSRTHFEIWYLAHRLSQSNKGAMYININFSK